MSFNIQCAFSRQVIAEGDACQVIVIQQRTTPKPILAEINGVSYSLHPASNVFAVADNRWSMASAFLSGEYIGEGRISLYDNAHNKTVLIRLIRMLYEDSLVVPAAGPNEPPVFDVKRMVSMFAPAVTLLMEDPFAEIDLGKVPFDELASLWSYVEEVIQQGKAFLMNETRMPCALGMCAMHQVAFENLCRVGEHSRIRDIDYSRVAFFNSLFHMLEGSVTDDNVHEHATTPWTVFQLQANTLTRLQRSENALVIPFEAQLRESALALVKDKNLKSYAAKVQSILDGLYVLRGINLLNLHFEPSHLVNSDENPLADTVYAEFVNKTSQTVQNQYRILEAKVA